MLALLLAQTGASEQAHAADRTRRLLRLGRLPKVARALTRKSELGWESRDRFRATQTGNNSGSPILGVPSMSAAAGSAGD
jgi:hypothetical protein